MAQRRKRLHLAREHEHLSAQDWVITSLVMSLKNICCFFHVPNRQDDTVWGSQSENVPDVNCVKVTAHTWAIFFPKNRFFSFFDIL